MSNGPLARRTAFTLVELLVVIAVIAILLLLLLPAINAAREAARMSLCKNNIRQLGVAMINHHGAHRRLPSGWISKEIDEPGGEPGWGWGVELLPFLERKQLYETGFNRSLPISDPANEIARQTIVSAFLCPSDDSPHLVPLPEGDGHAHSHGDGDNHDDDEEEHEILFSVARSNYAGVFGTEEIEDDPANGNGVLYLNSRVRFQDISDGLSSTIMLGERSSKLGHTVWVGVVEGADESMARIVGSTDHTPNAAVGHFDDFSSHHPTGAHFALGDGAVMLLTDQVDPEVYKALATRRGRDQVRADFGN